MAERVFVIGLDGATGAGMREAAAQIRDDPPDAMGDAGVLDDSLVVVLSDHGGEGRSHGSDSPLCMTTFWGRRGPGVVRGAELRSPIEITDTAAVIAEALGLARPAGWDARVPAGHSGSGPPVSPGRRLSRIPGTEQACTSTTGTT